MSHTQYLSCGVPCQKENHEEQSVFSNQSYSGGMGTWIENPTIVDKEEAVQYLMNDLFFIPYGLLFPWKDNWKYVFVTA